MMTDFCLFVSFVHETVEHLCLQISPRNVKAVNNKSYLILKKYQQSETNSGKHCELEDVVKNYAVSIKFLM